MRGMTDPDGVRDGAPLVDESTEFGSRVARRLREEVVVWLTTVGPSGAPSPNPVWFLWDGRGTVTVHSLPAAARVAHLRANPRVTLHPDGNGQGGDIIVLSGVARLRPDDPSAAAQPDYLAKYADHIRRIGHTPESFAARYSLPISVNLTRLRGH